MKVRRGLAAASGIVSAIAIGIAMESGDPARAVGVPQDGAYALNMAGVSGVTWTITALCDQPSGTRNMNDYSDPIVQAFNCALNVVSTTPQNITHAEAVQNYSARARLSSVLWTFEITQANGAQCADGTTAPSTEKYAFDDATLAGTHTTLRGAVCGQQPTMTKQPFSLALTGPPPSPIQRYPLYCNGIAMCY